MKINTDTHRHTSVFVEQASPVKNKKCWDSDIQDFKFGEKLRPRLFETNTFGGNQDIINSLANHCVSQKQGNPDAQLFQVEMKLKGQKRGTQQQTFFKIFLPVGPFFLF